MRGEQDPNADPYRTLGLEPGASLAEVKRAYRQLAKAFHPDSAGEAAVDRFLAVNAAYEQLKTGQNVTGAKTARAAPAEPWRADPARARAARERARTARPGRTGPTSATGATGSTGPAGSDGGARSRAGASGTSGAGGSGTGGRASTGTRGSGRRRDVRKATMGSTSYDEARDPSDATWSGASWYGPSSGEYWIVNPREYADPRKHGPEYQQRARRPIDGDMGEAAPPMAASTGAASSARPADAAPERPSWTWGSPEARADRDARARRWAPDPAAAARTAPAGAEPPRAEGPRHRPGEAAPDTARIEALGAASRAWLGGPADDPIRRLGLALVAWPPIGLAAVAAIGEVTGCTGYSAACSGAEPLLPWLAQAAILGLLLLLPPVTRLLAGGAIAVLFALVPITAFLIAVGGGGAPQAGFVLAVLLGVAWVVGVAWATRAFRRGRLARAGP